MKLTLTAETGATFVPFLRKNIKAAYVAWASRRSPSRTKKTSSDGTPKPRLGELSVVLVGDKRMSALHMQFMSLGSTTDVLTFPLDSDSGEVVICVPEARRRAKELNNSTRLELLLYAVHGMLHLLGYDDRTDRAYRIMHRTEDAILTELGFGPVFAGAGSGAT